MSETVNLSNIKVLSEAKYNALTNKPNNVLHFVELPMETYIIETYMSGTSWYRIWSDGWCEQGGQFATNSTWTATTVTLSIPYMNTTYNITSSGPGYTANTDAWCISERTASSFTATGLNTTGLATWRTAGYIDLSNL
jgi:hypothetical protein